MINNSLAKERTFYCLNEQFALNKTRELKLKIKQVLINSCLLENLQSDRKLEI